MTSGWTVDDWLAAYHSGSTPSELLFPLLDKLSLSDVAWISLVDRAHLEQQIKTLEDRQNSTNDEKLLPLFGVPFAVKDNIDVAHLSTTAACPAFAYTPTTNAFVVEQLTVGGAIVIGKTNLDQFATGLVGVRSPYGAVPNAFNVEYISGGSSSGSASVVARGIVPFSLGTDTAGSGRVPAGLNNIVGLKPTKGALSGTGLVKACRTLDCISVFATTVADASAVFEICRGFDAADGFSRSKPASVVSSDLPARPCFGIPAVAEFYGDEQSANAYEDALKQIEASGAVLKRIDFTLFDQVAALLYNGPWVAERYAAIEKFAVSNAEDMHPVVREIIFQAKKYSAADTFNAFYELADLKRKADQIMADVDGLLVPTAPCHFKITQVEADPVRLNSQLGKYTNFVNLLDWCALAVPVGFRADGLPFGLTLIAPAWHDEQLAQYGRRLQEQLALTRGATGRPFLR
uniref:Amidase domain-containing protein n=1 Tax=Plectus sambesii TaxID=2011161 RepID=A0A914VIS8_9BILA